MPGRFRAGHLLWPLTLVLVGLAVWLVAWNVYRPRGYPDTFDYTSLALQYRGVDRVSADKAAIRFAAQYAKPGVITAAFSIYDRSFEQGAFEVPKYRGIFEGRPLYPLAGALLMPLFGLNAMIVATALAGIIFAVSLGLIVEMLTGSRLLALAAIGAAYALPLGLWLVALIADGWVLAMWTVSLGFAILYLRHRQVEWLAGFTASAVLLAAAKSVNFDVLAATMVSVTVLSLLGNRRNTRRLLELTAVSLAIFAGVVALSALFGLPGLQDFSQDLLSRHYTQPPVAHPWRQLVALSLYRTPIVLRGFGPRFWIIIALAAAPLIVARRLWAAIWLVGAGGSFMLFVLHPEPSEIPRYLAPVWISVVVGLSLLPEFVRPMLRAAWRPAPAFAD